MTEEPTPPEADDLDEDLDDEPEVEGFMISGPSIGSMGSIFAPIKGGPDKTALPPTNPNPSTIPGKPGSSTPGPVTFPGPS